MININTTTNKAIFKGIEYDIIAKQSLDANSVHITLDGCGTIFFTKDVVTIDGKPCYDGYFIDITELKKQLVSQIDAKSEAAIYNGFTFAGKNFSLSLSAQINWLGLSTLPQQAFPINLSTKNDDVYVLDFANRDNFYFTALNGKNAPLQAGNILKQQITDATTIEELNAIVI